LRPLGFSGPIDLQPAKPKSSQQASCARLWVPAGSAATLPTAKAAVGS